MTLSTISRSGVPTGAAKVELPPLPEAGPGHLIRGVLDVSTNSGGRSANGSATRATTPRPSHSSEHTN